MSSGWLSRFVELSLSKSGIAFTNDVQLLEDVDRGPCEVAAAAAECEASDVLLGEEGIEAAEGGYFPSKSLSVRLRIVVTQ